MLTINENTNEMTLSSLPIGSSAFVSGLMSNGKERRRMLDLGLIEGTQVEALRRSPSGDPIAYFIRGAVVAIRDTDADKIVVRSIN